MCALVIAGVFALGGWAVAAGGGGTTTGSDPSARFTIDESIGVAPFERVGDVAADVPDVTEMIPGPTMPLPTAWAA